MSYLSAYELLPTGTEVYVNSNFGKVISSNLVPAHPCGFVSNHVIEFTHKVFAKRTKAGNKIYELIEIPPFRSTPNYSFIRTDQ